MPTSLAEMFGAVGMPMFPGPQLIMFSESDSPPIRRTIDGEPDVSPERHCELMEAMVMQSAIGK
jgi:hypothetical protein